MFTKQKEYEVFLARWGCAFTCLINICEASLKRKITVNEFYMLIGKTYATRSVLICNYKNKKNAIKNQLAPDGWSEKADPLYHYFIIDHKKAIKDMSNLLNIELVKGAYYVKLKTKYGKHFTVFIPGYGIVNPDESVVGTPIIEDQRVYLT